MKLKLEPDCRKDRSCRRARVVPRPERPPTLPPADTVDLGPSHACMIKRRAVRRAPAHVAVDPDTRPSATRVDQQRRHARAEPPALLAAASRPGVPTRAAAARGLDADPISFK